MIIPTLRRLNADISGFCVFIIFFEEYDFDGNFVKRDIQKYTTNEALQDIIAEKYLTNILFKTNPNYKLDFWTMNIVIKEEKPKLRK